MRSFRPRALGTVAAALSVGLVAAACGGGGNSGGAPGQYIV